MTTAPHRINLRISSAASSTTCLGARQSAPGSSPSRTSASTKFGVTRLLKGPRRSRTAARAVSSPNRAPDVATNTGSRTTGTRGRFGARLAKNRSRPSAMAWTASAEPTMPILMASAGRSLAKASTWAAMHSGVAAWTWVTPTEFWAVRAVTTLQPWHPKSRIVGRSAWIPAPPPLSLPAMVHTTGGLREESEETGLSAAKRRAAHQAATNFAMALESRAGCG
mmetsp:Transcript_20626/g.46533  ORF Transcript_20626/g.46533 Transcript_20626/m.46533 type:complete len:223 (-) Transcript_20626:35-703(-)